MCVRPTVVYVGLYIDICVCACIMYVNTCVCVRGVCGRAYVCGACECIICECMCARLRWCRRAVVRYCVNLYACVGLLLVDLRGLFDIGIPVHQPRCMTLDNLIALHFLTSSCPVI